MHSEVPPLHHPPGANLGNARPLTTEYQRWYGRQQLAGLHQRNALVRELCHISLELWVNHDMKDEQSRRCHVRCHASRNLPILQRSLPISDAYAVATWRLVLEVVMWFLNKRYSYGGGDGMMIGVEIYVNFINF